MYSITDLKKGIIINLNGSPYKVLEYDHSSMGRGGAVVRTKLRSLVDGSVLSKTFRGNEKIEPANIEPVKAQFLYSDGDQAHFMRADNYEQVGVPIEKMGEDLQFIKEGMEISLLYHDQSPIAHELPIKVDLEVEQADPGIKGDSASNVTKKCRLETGAQAQVPLFIEAGDIVRIDTRSGDYIERVS